MLQGLTLGGLVLVAAMQAAPAQAIESTADLRAACASGDMATRNLCFGFMQGAGQLYTELRRADVIGQIACADPVPTMESIRTSVVDWIDANPQHLSDRAVDSLLRASAAIWPCE